MQDNFTLLGFDKVFNIEKIITVFGCGGNRDRGKRAKMGELAGKYADFPHLIRYFSTDHVKIICDKPTGINLDGEKREAEIIDMSVAKEKIRFFYPKGITFKKEEAKEAATV